MVRLRKNADTQNQASPAQYQANCIDHPGLQSSSPAGTAYNPLTHSQANHNRLPFHNSAHAGVHFRSGDGHTQAENSQIGRGATLLGITEDRGQSDQLTHSTPSIDIAPTQ